MNTNHARALTHVALVSLQVALDQAQNPDDFFAEADAIIKKPENLLELPVNSGIPEILEPGSLGDSGRDVENAPLVYEFLGAMDRSNAADRRLWTYLAFSTYRSYMEKRWPPAESRNWKSRVNDRWLMSNATRGKLIRHGIARLWWVAALTYDAKREYPLSVDDSFAYTREVFRNEDRINSLFDREVGANPSIVRAVLEHAAQGGAYGKDKHLAALMKELRLVYGYRDIGALDSNATHVLVAESAPRVRPIS
ncbi:hypothetical protein GCM10027417_11740 [Glutamicibacter endophyticus]